MTEERSWAVACSLGSLGLMSCKSRAEDFARRLHTKLKTLGGLAHDDDADECDKSAAEAGEHNRLVNPADAACFPQPVQTCLTEDDDLFYDFDLESPDSPATDPDLLHLNPCDSLCNGGEEIRRKGGGGGGRVSGNGVATTQPVSVMRETELYCPCTEHRDSGVGCGLSDRGGDMSPPTPIAYTPPEEFPTTDRESAYCSGGEQEPNVLGQGHCEEGLTKALLERFNLYDKENEVRSRDGETELFKDCSNLKGENELCDAMMNDNGDIDVRIFHNGVVRNVWDVQETKSSQQDDDLVFFGYEDCTDTCDRLLDNANTSDSHGEFADDISKQVLDVLVREACAGEKGDEPTVDTTDTCLDDVSRECDSPVSPTWGSLKKIDRFQVRQLVNEDGSTLDVTELDNTLETTEINTIEAETESEEKTEVDTSLKTESNLENESVQATTSSADGQLTTITVSVLDDQPTEPSPLSPISANLLDDRPRHMYRSSSLKTGKTPPGTPGRKKIVRFADVFGLDLEDVRHIFLDDLPQVPQSAYSDLDASLIMTSNNQAQITSSPPSNSVTHSCSRQIPTHHRPAKSLIPMFSQPCSSQRFLERVREQKVCLESANVANVGITGFVRVLNLAFHKAVIVRYTLNEWRSFLEVEGNFVPGGSDSVSDRFAFALYGGETLGIGERLVFCIRYHTLGQNYWDNNNGQNYFFQCIADNYQLPPSPLDTWDLFL